MAKPRLNAKLILKSYEDDIAAAALNDLAITECANIAMATAGTIIDVKPSAELTLQIHSIDPPSPILDWLHPAIIKIRNELGKQIVIEMNDRTNTVIIRPARKEPVS